jgi:hypothetical protein
VSNLIGVCPVLAFTAHGTLVITDAATKYQKGNNCSDVRNGRTVAVTGVELLDKSVRATNIEVK